MTSNCCYANLFKRTPFLWHGIRVNTDRRKEMWNMLKITSHRDGAALTLQLEGKLAGPWVAELEACWRATGSGSDGPIRVDLSAVTFVDSAGRDLLALLHEHGAEFIAEDCMMCAIVSEIHRHRKPGRKPAGQAPNLAIAALFALLSLLSVGHSAIAQEKQPMSLTLREALQMALEEDPQMQIAMLDIARSKQDRDIARSELLPQAGIGMSEDARRLNLEANIGQSFPGAPRHSGPFQVFQVGPQVSMPVFDLTLWRRYQVAQRDVQATEAQALTVREQVALLVVSQYLGALRAVADVRAARSRVELAQALYDQAADLQKHGVGTGIDTLRANVQLQTEKQRLITAETQRKTLFFGLVRLLNLDPLQSIQLGDELKFSEGSEPQAELAVQIEQALTNRPEVKALAWREQIARSDRLEARDSRLPSIQASGFWTQQGISTDSAIPAYQVQVGLTMPLFTGGRIRAAVRKADIELSRIARERDELRNQIALEVKTANVELESARHEVEVADLNVLLAREEVAQARDRFQAGVADNIEVVTAQDALARANDSQIGALYRFNQARADLAHASGRTETMYPR